LKARIFLTLAIVFVCSLTLAAATHLPYKLPAIDTPATDSVKQTDMADVLRELFKTNDKLKQQRSQKKVNISLVPTVGYTLSTGFTIGASSLLTFFTKANHVGNESVINAQAFYDTQSQKTFYVQSNIWSGNDQWKFVTDFRYNQYPDVTYGLGNLTTQSNADNIDFNYIRFYQTFFKKIVTHFYAGAGYNLDHHFNIEEFGGSSTAATTSFDRYGITTATRSAGFNLSTLFDSRDNPVNPLHGFYGSIVFRKNLKPLGSDSKWTSLLIDLRKYIKLSSHSNNVLAFWSYTWVVLNGRPPYLDLPSVGNDTYNNTGRGYAIDRFRGRNMVYLEGEYRFGITRNGLIGGVLFANVESYSRTVTTNIKNVLPAAGPGIRIKINKHSNTNLAIDYGFGTGGSRGVFVNLGEVF
jgi:hypothetical protein